MSNNNNPPFYPGQKIVRTGPSNLSFVKGDVYTAGVCFQSSCDCGIWNVPIMEFPYKRKITTFYCAFCHEKERASFPDYVLGDSRMFAPLHYSSVTAELAAGVTVGDTQDVKPKEVAPCS